MENSTINAVLSELNCTAFGAVNKRSSIFNKNTIPNIALEMDTQMSSFNLTVCQRGKTQSPIQPNKRTSQSETYVDNTACFIPQAENSREVECLSSLPVMSVMGSVLQFLGTE